MAAAERSLAAGMLMLLIHKNEGISAAFARSPASVRVCALRVWADGSGPGLGLGELLPDARQPDVLADRHDGGHEHGRQ